MYVNPADGSFLDYAHLRSPLLREASATCRLNFWYYLHSFTSSPFDAQLVVVIAHKDGSKVY